MIKSLTVMLWLACGTLAWAFPADDPPSIQSLDNESVEAPRLEEVPGDAGATKLVVPPVAEFPEATPTEPNPKIEGWIQDALNGKDVGETGIPLLDEALKGVRNRGSVVDNFPELNPEESRPTADRRDSKRQRNDPHPPRGRTTRPNSKPDAPEMDRSAPPHVRPAPARQREDAERDPRKELGPPNQYRPGPHHQGPPIGPMIPNTGPFPAPALPMPHSVQGNPYALPHATHQRRTAPWFPLPPDSAAPASLPEAQYRMAETLLRGARMLAEMPGNDPQRTETIRLMRLQAFKCLMPDMQLQPAIATY